MNITLNTLDTLNIQFSEIDLPPIDLPEQQPTTRKRKHDAIETTNTSSSYDQRFDKKRSAALSFNKGVRFISKITFGLKSPEEIKKQSVCQVSDITIYNKNKPRHNAINDHRMGTVDRRIRCGTCGHNIEDCNGHTGHIELAIPLYNVGFMDIVLAILRSVCYFCSSPMIPRDACEEFQKLEPYERFQAVTVAAKKYTSCWNCGGSRPLYKYATKQQSVSISRTWADGTVWADTHEEGYAQQPFTAALARDILMQISDTDCERLGIVTRETRPENYITTTLLVPAPCIRPAIMVSEGSRARGQDDLTRKLQDILKQNQAVVNTLKKQKSNVMEKALLKAMEELQYHYAVYIDNDVKGLKPDTQRSGAPIRGITQRIKGKQGLVRTHMMGKRVDFSSRTVISPDPTLDVDEIGVPLYVATLLTKPVVVGPATIRELSRRVRIGADNVDGALLIEYPNGRKRHLGSNNKNRHIPLPNGAIVHRYLQNGDYVIFNRHPSLHKQSLMGHRVRIMPIGDTFRMSLPCTTPYNADFDGEKFSSLSTGRLKRLKLPSHRLT